MKTIRASAEARTEGRLVPALLLLILALITGCRESPEEVLRRARESLAASDYEQFYSLLEPRAADLLRRSQEVLVASGRIYATTREPRPTSALLPQGDIESIQEEPRRVVMVLRQGRARSPVYFRLVQGQWRLDLLEMQPFWEQTRPNEQGAQ